MNTMFGGRSAARADPVTTAKAISPIVEVRNMGHFLGVLGVGIGAPTDLRHATSFACRSFAFSGFLAARLVCSDRSSRKRYSSCRPPSKNSISFQSPSRTAPAGVDRHESLPPPKYPGKCQ